MRITISFPAEWEDDFKHAEAKENTSFYIRQLIRRDRLKRDENIEDKIMKLLNQALKNGKEINNIEISTHKKNALKNFLNL